MKKSLLFSLWIIYFSSIALKAQNIGTHLQGYHKRAEKLFSLYAYAGALENYMKVHEKEPNNKAVILKIAESYRFLNDPKNAAIWYGKIIDEELLIRPEHKLHYAEALSQIKQYAKAKKWYEAYQKDAQELGYQDYRPQRKLYGIDRLNSFHRDSAQYKIWKTNLNSVESDFGLSYFRNGIIFSSSRPRNTFVKRTFTWVDKQFLDMYFAERVTGDTTFSEPQLFHLDMNTKFHDGTLCLYDRERKIIFTRNQYFDGKVKRSDDQVHKLSLYYAELDSSAKIINEKDLPFNNPQISNGHPTVTPDGKTLIFVSDRPGGVGQTDLYMIPTDSLTTATPRNLGAHINTKGKEMFPFVASDNTLYFASDGREGLGGLDIYRVKLNKITPDSVFIQRIKNLGSPINSSKDDFGLIVAQNLMRGHFCSNRDEGMGSDDIYATELPIENPTVLIANIKLFKKYPNKMVVENLKGATLKLFDYQDSTLIGIADSDQEGNHIFDISTDNVYQVTGEKIPFGTDLKIADVPIGVQDTVRVNLKLEYEMPTCISYQGRVVDKKTGEPLHEATVFIYNEKTKKLEETMTGIDGSFTACLDTMSSYIMRSVKRYYLPDCYRINTKGLTYETIEAKRDLELRKLELNTTFEVENLYFDFDKYNIRPDAAKVLDELVQFLNEHDYLKVELGSHTDSRGNFRYNEKLSDNRAKSSVAYIVRKGISKARITAKGYGEYQLTNKCADGIRCTAEEHQANRRTEVKVIGILEKPNAEISDRDSGHGQPFDKEKDYSACLPVDTQVVQLSEGE